MDGKRQTANGRRPDLIIFVSLPGSGKSTWYFAHFADTHVHVSKDLMLRGRSSNAGQSKMVDDALTSGRSVVVDNTNPSPAVRAPLIAIGKRHEARTIAYYFECSVRTALMRNRQREGRGRVPDVAIVTSARKVVPRGVRGIR